MVSVLNQKYSVQKRKLFVSYFDGCWDTASGTVSGGLNGPADWAM